MPAIVETAEQREQRGQKPSYVEGRRVVSAAGSGQPAEAADKRPAAGEDRVRLGGRRDFTICSERMNSNAYRIPMLPVHTQPPPRYYR